MLRWRDVGSIRLRGLTVREGKRARSQHLELRTGLRGRLLGVGAENRCTVYIGWSQKRMPKCCCFAGNGSG